MVANKFEKYSTFKVMSSAADKGSVSAREKKAATSVFFMSMDPCKTDKLTKKAGSEELDLTDAKDRNVMNYMVCKKDLDKATAASDALFSKLDLAGMSKGNSKKSPTIDW